MKTDQIIERLETVEAENKELRARNIDLILQLRRVRQGLESALNILDPDQLLVIHRDLLEK